MAATKTIYYYVTSSSTTMILPLCNCIRAPILGGSIPFLTALNRHFSLGATHEKRVHIFAHFLPKQFRRISFRLRTLRKCHAVTFSAVRSFNIDIMLTSLNVTAWPNQNTIRTIRRRSFRIRVLKIWPYGVLLSSESHRRIIDSLEICWLFKMAWPS